MNMRLRLDEKLSLWLLRSLQLTMVKLVVVLLALVTGLRVVIILCVVRCARVVSIVLVMLVRCCVSVGVGLWCVS